MKTKDKKYIILAIFVIIVLLLIALLIYPTLKDIKNSYEEVLSNKGKVISVDKEVKELDNFVRNYKNYEPDLKKLDRLFIDPKNPIDFIKFLEKIALDSDVKIDINLVQSEKKETASFQVHIQGDFLNALKFSERMEKSPYLDRIQSLTMQKLIKKEETSPNQVGANFSLEIIAKSPSQ